MRYKTRLLELVTMPCRFGAIETTTLRLWTCRQKGMSERWA
jgi:hypothetical protein